MSQIVLTDGKPKNVTHKRLSNVCLQFVSSPVEWCQTDEEPAYKLINLPMGNKVTVMSGKTPMKPNEEGRGPSTHETHSST